MASGYDVTIKLYQHHMIERATKRIMHAVCVVDAINVLMYFVVVSLLFPLLTKHSSVALPCKGFVNKRPVNDLSIHYSYTTPHPNH